MVIQYFYTDKFHLFMHKAMQIQGCLQLEQEGTVCLTTNKWKPCGKGKATSSMVDYQQHHVKFPLPAGNMTSLSI